MFSPLSKGELEGVIVVFSTFVKGELEGVVVVFSPFVKGELEGVVVFTARISPRRHPPHALRPCNRTPLTPVRALNNPYPDKPPAHRSPLRIPYMCNVSYPVTITSPSFAFR